MNLPQTFDRKPHVASILQNAERLIAKTTRQLERLSREAEVATRTIAEVSYFRERSAAISSGSPKPVIAPAIVGIG